MKRLLTAAELGTYVQLIFVKAAARDGYDSRPIGCQRSS